MTEQDKTYKTSADLPPPWWRRRLGLLALALAFLTRFPVSLSDEDAKRPLGDAVAAFPVVGVIVGGLGGIMLMAAAGLTLHPLACALLGIGFATLIAGALHEDGLADFADGLGGGKDKEDSLRIFRDSRIGSYGVLALIFAVGLKVTALSGLLSPAVAAATLASGAAVSRSLMGPMMWFMSPARDDGLGQRAGKPHAFEVVLGLVLAGVVTLFLAPFWAGLAGMIVAALGALGVAYLAQRRVGGQTGDVLGAAQQVAEVGFLLTVGAIAG